ncbi:cupin domain-containing protein [Bacillus sp. OK048]|uniref:cupin domain-containing protein n=1 Tax=Bacillus sp. OK048 TaxID=1882761 RepID=UPI000882A4F7|nr:cupin domain-containing protein [Bacillus sp. OK048]SDM35632.1 gentisate 1,2-dioxygenase [Bacillus sp. OK048]
MAGPVKVTPEMDAFHQEVSKDAFEPLWMAAPEVMHRQPKSKPIPYIWKREVIERHMNKAAEIINFNNGGDRRVLMLINPGMRDLEPYGWGATTQTLSVCVQILLPGEEAPPHRHTQTALRYIVKGEGAYSAVEGEKVYMSEGDYVITPKGLWHEHEHEGTEPMMWMDCLDTPLIFYLHGTFFEPHALKKQPITRKPSINKYQGGMVRPLADHSPSQAPLPAYKYNTTLAALKGLSDHYDPDSVEGYVVEYINPSNGQSANENIGAWLQKLPVGFHGKAHRHVNSVVYHIKEGKGYSLIDGIRFDWEKGDYLVIPTWALHEHVNTSDTEEAILFSTNDIPIFERMELQRVEEYTENEGFQVEVGQFSPVQVNV